MPRKWKYFKEVVGDSPLAEVIGDENDWRSSRERRKNERVTAYTVHMTGSGIVAKALKNDIDPYEMALSYYVGKARSSHYLIGYDGHIYQMTDDHLRVGHVGVYEGEKKAYRNGSWEKGKKARGSKKEGLIGPVSKTAVKYWHQYWPHYKSPQDIAKFLGHTSINNCTLSSEMPPCGRHVGGKWTALPDWPPMRPGLRHTTQQHLAVAFLACDIADRWGWTGRWWEDPKGGPRSPYIHTHEDVDLYGRSNKHGGWDIGLLKQNQWFDWEFVIQTIRWRQAFGPLASFIGKAFDVFKLPG